MKKRMTAILCALALLASMFPLTGASAGQAQFQVGYGKRDITPDASLPLAGYGDTFTRLSTVDADGHTVRMDDNGDGVVNGEDGLFATCIAFRDENGQVMLWIAHDMIGANEAIVNKLQYRIKQRWGITEEYVLLNGSHTHSGVDLGKYTGYVTVSSAPDPGHEGYDADAWNSSYGNLDAEKKTVVDNMKVYVYEVLLAGLMGAVEDALADLAPAAMRTGTIQAPNLNFIRHYYDTDEGTDPAHVFGDNTTGYSDYVRSYQDANDTMYLIEFTRDGKEPVVAVDWRAHPKLNSTNTSTFGKAFRPYVSSDYVNAFRHDLEQAGYKPAFFEGTAGNVNTFSDIYIVSKKPDYLADEGNPTDKDTVVSYTNGSSTKASQIGYLYGQKLASYALQGLAQNMTSAETGLINAQRRLIYADYDTHENYKMVGGNGLEGMLKEIVTDSKNVEYTVYNYLQTYYAYKTVPKAEKTQVNSLLSKYGINSVYHLDRVYGKFTSTMTKNADGEYVLKSSYQGSFQLCAFSIGNSVGCVTAPFEIFDYPYAFRGEQFPMTFVLGYSNGNKGYMPTEETYQFAGGRGAYEANNTSYAPGTAEMIGTVHKQMLEGLDRSGLPDVCPACGEAAVWHPYANVSELPGGHYYLPSDIVQPQSQMNIRGGETVCLYLNGHTLSNTSSASSRLFALFRDAVKGPGVLNIMGNGVLESRGTKVSVNPDTGAVNASPYPNGGLIHCNVGGVVNIYGGVLRYQQLDEEQWIQYGGVMTCHGTVNMYGGTITMGTPPRGVKVKTVHGGLLHVDSGGTFHMYGGLITGGLVAANGYGNNIFVGNGSVILEGRSQLDGGVHLASANSALTVSGDVKLMNYDDCGVHMTSAAARIDATGLTSDAEIWVDTSVVPKQIAQVSQLWQARLFHYDGPARIACSAEGVVSSAAAGTNGDLTGDAKVNGKDVVMMQRCVAGGYSTEIDMLMADLNGDGKVNGKDVVLMQRYVAGGYDVVL